MTRLLTLAIAIVATLALSATTHTVDNVPNVHLQDRTRYVSNPDGILSPSAQARADSIIGSIWERTSAEVVAVVIDDFEGDDIDDFTTELFEKWRIGKKDKDNGLLMVIAKDRRRAAIRTGYGLEGALPDITCGRLLRGVLFPALKEGDFDSGVTNTLSSINSILSDEATIDEIMSAYANDADASGESGDEFFTIYLYLCALAATLCLIYVVAVLIKSSKLSDYERYIKLEKSSGVMLFCVFITLGMALIAWLPMWLIMRHLREKPHFCPHCAHKMEKLSEELDNQYLTPAQDLEERVNSIDYDVWLCPQCNATEIIPYVNRSSTMTECENCGARTCQLQGATMLRRPTASQEGIGEKTYLCLNCHHTHKKRYTIPRDNSGAVAAGAVLGSMASRRGGGGFGGGGFSGGSFGGGFTGGGGASGGW